MATVKLGDIAIETKSSNKGDKTGIRIVGLEHLTPSNVTLSSWSEDTENTFTKEFSKGDVLFGRRRAYLKKAAVAPFDGICSGDITVIRAIEDKVDPDLLPFIIQNDLLFDFAVGKSAGSLSPRVKWTHLKEFAIELPSMPEQSKLAETLWSINETKNAYEDLINKTDELVKSQFIEMFGKGFETIKLCDLATFRRGSFPQPYGKPEWYDGEGAMPFVQVADVGENMRLVEDTKQKISVLAQPKSIYVSTGSVVVTLQGSIGRVAITQYDCYMDRTLAVFESFKTEVNKLCFAYQLKQKFAKEAEVARGVTIKTITKEEFSNFEIAKVPIALQNRFAEFIQQSDKSKFALQEAIKDLDALSKKIIAENLIPAGKE